MRRFVEVSLLDVLSNIHNNQSKIQFARMLYINFVFRMFLLLNYLMH